MKTEYVFLGRIVNTHGIKGELRILSSFEYKKQIFVPNFPIYVGENKEKQEIVSYRHHKEFEMVTLNGYNNINEVLKYKGKNVYVLREDLNLGDNYLLDDLINLDIYHNDTKIGVVDDIIDNNSNILLHISGENKFYIPKNNNFIKSVNLSKNRIDVENIEGLIL